MFQKGVLNANEFEFVPPEREIEGADSELVKHVADEIALAGVADKLVFSMTRLIDPFAGKVVHLGPTLLPKSGALAISQKPAWRRTSTHA